MKDDVVDKFLTNVGVKVVEMSGAKVTNICFRISEMNKLAKLYFLNRPN